MKAELLTIGDELLIGQVVNTNAAFLAKSLNSIGVHVTRMNTISDEPEDITGYLNEASRRVRLIISTGGLGPTKDDTTKESFCRFLGDELVLNTDVLSHVEYLFANYISTPISERNRQQAMVPSKARVLHNPHGTAPGLWMEKSDAVFIALPGVPYEMKYLVSQEVLPRLRERFDMDVILHRTLLTYGVGESAIADQIEHIEDSLPAHIRLAYLPNAGRVRLRLSARGSDRQLLQAEMEGVVQQLYGEIGDIIAGEEGDGELPAQIGRVLVQQGWRLSVAESLTGGRIASSMVEVEGASAFFAGGVVTYATESKISVLGVPAEVIARHSVVSAEVAGEMARRVALLFGTEIGVATTGVAGPDPGESGQKTGTVWIGIHTPTGTITESFAFGTHRERITLKSVNKALEMAYGELRKISTQIL